MITFFQIIGGLILLFVGGEVLVRGAVALAKHLGIPTLVIGLTIVAFGTSAPEMVVSVQAALSNHPEIAVGNIIGSNIANILLVLGISAAIYPISIDKRILKFDNPTLLSVTALCIFFFWTDSSLVPMEGIILILCLLAYTWYTIKLEHKSKTGIAKQTQKEIEKELPSDVSNFRAVFYILLGCSLLAYGSDILVEGAVTLAILFGVSKEVIGVTLVAIGSSTPEIATCTVAAYRKHSDIVMGNVIGSNLLNIMAGLGVASIITPLPVSHQFLKFDIWVVLAATLVMIIVSKPERKIGRATGMLFFISYIVYIASQFLKT